jgi:hypothetical protein
MTFTHSSRFVATIAGVALASALLVGAFATATPAKAAALTQTQVNAIVSLLQSFGASADVIANVQASLTGGTPTSGGGSTGGTGAACYAWTRALTVGSNGADVMALQQFLNSDASTMVAASGAGSPGNETMTFGPATKAAVIKFQVKNGITPAAGYFGPISRAAVAAKCSPTTTPPGTTPPGGTPVLQGGEGTLDVNGNLGDVESEVDEGDSDVQVLGVELEADDSDIMIERVDIDITLSGTGSSQIDNYVDEITLWLDGTKIGTLDADEGDEDNNDVFSFRFTGLKGVIEEGEEGELYVAVSAVGNIDSGDTAKVLSIDVPADGIRAVDAAGISDTYATAGEVTAETFSVEESEGGDLDLTEGDDNPDSTVVMVDEDDDTDDVLALEF